MVYRKNFQWILGKTSRDSGKNLRRILVRISEGFLGSTFEGLWAESAKDSGENLRGILGRVFEVILARDSGLNFRGILG